MSKQVLAGPEVLTKLLAGVNLIANPVKVSLGPSGRNAVYERLQTNLPVSTRDGVTIAEAIEGTDPFESIGVNLVKGVAREAVDQSGDGTTTATLLAQAIFSEGVKSITVGANPVALKRGIEKATTAVLESLKSMAVPVSGDMLRQVATISANNDPFLGGLIADAMDKAGPDGVVTVEISQSPESSLQVVDGLQIGTGFLSPYFINNPEKNECILENVAVFLHEGKLPAITPMRAILGELSKCAKHLKPACPECIWGARSLLVIAEDVTDEALAVLSISARNGPLRCAAIRTPGGVDNLHDIAALCGGRVLTELLGVKLQDVGMDFMGTAKKVIVKPQSTTIMAHERTPRLEKRLQELRTQVSDATDEGHRLRLQARLARLAGGIAIIKVGAATELEMNERRDRLDDSLHATRCAQQEGVLPGGGVALARACPDIFNLVTDPDEQAGISIVRKACLAPLRTLAENAGESAQFILKEVLREDNPYGWNARTNTYGDMIEMGIVDPLRVVRVALESAASVASLMLITNCLVSNERK
jgi:chaperonin GroEL